MRALVQRTRGLVSLQIEKQVQSFDGFGLVCLLCWEKSDETLKNLEQNEDWLRDRVWGLRIFPDAQDRMNLDLDSFLKSKPENEKGGILWVSQFTLSAELESGFRPSFINSMNAEMAQKSFENFQKKTLEKKNHPRIKNFFGSFGADMTLSFSNWGPVTIPLAK